VPFGDLLAFSASICDVRGKRVTLMSAAHMKKGR
jgi:hypothetical protein